jgi:hypothetical protein
MRPLVLLLACACAESGPRWPQISPGDGALLSPLQLVAIVPSGHEYEYELTDFSQSLFAIEWWRSLADEYHLQAGGATVLTGKPMHQTSLTTHDVLEYVTDAIASGPQPNGNTFYLLFIPYGIPVGNCDKYGGYHAPFGRLGDNLGIAQNCVDDSLSVYTVVASHEISEAATDPDLRSWSLAPAPPHEPWRDDIWRSFNFGGHEIGDLCEETRWTEGPYVYQRLWSNRAAHSGPDPCAPLRNDPYFNLIVGGEWFQVAPGKQVGIPLHAWSQGDKPLQISVAILPAGGFSIDHLDGIDQQGLLDVRIDASLVVDADPTIPSGSFGVLTLFSSAEGSDESHMTLAGVYVP